MTEHPVGILVSASARVICEDCAQHVPESPGVPIYRVNIYPYRQNCALCNRVLVEPQTPAWPELYDGRQAERGK